MPLLNHLLCLFQLNLRLLGFLKINEHWRIAFVSQVRKQAIENKYENSFFSANFLGVFIGTVLPPIIVRSADKLPLLVRRDILISFQFYSIDSI